jgi:hypothetical protein
VQREVVQDSVHSDLPRRAEIETVPGYPSRTEASAACGSPRSSNTALACRQQSRSYGLIKFISSYDGKVKGKLDMYALQTGMKLHDDSLQMLYEKCSANIICQLGIAAVDTIILSKVKVAYVWFKAIIG